MEALKRKTSPHTNLNKNDKHCIIVSCFQKRGSTLFLRDHYSCCLASRPRLHYDEKIWKRRFYSENAWSVFVHTTPGDLKTPQLPVNLDLFFRRTRSRKPHDYRGAIVFQQCRFHVVFRPLKNKQKAFVVKSLRRSWRAFSKSSVFVTD